MLTRQSRSIAAVGIAFLLISVAQSVAATIFDVSIGTAAVSGVSGQLAFDFIQGDPPNNAVTITNFSTNGSLGGVASTAGGVSGALPGTVTINDTVFFNELAQFITFGTFISFRVALTDNITGPAPDEFAFFLLDVTGAALVQTTDPTGADALLVIDVGGTPQPFAPLPGQPAVTVSVTPVPAAVIPEPGTFMLVGLGSVALAGCRRHRRTRATNPGGARPFEVAGNRV